MTCSEHINVANKQSTSELPVSLQRCFKVGYLCTFPLAAVGYCIALLFVIPNTNFYSSLPLALCSIFLANMANRCFSHVLPDKVMHSNHKIDNNNTDSTC